MPWLPIALLAPQPGALGPQWSGPYPPLQPRLFLILPRVAFWACPSPNTHRNLFTGFSCCDSKSLPPGEPSSARPALTCLPLLAPFTQRCPTAYQGSSHGEAAAPDRLPGHALPWPLPLPPSTSAQLPQQNSCWVLPMKLSSYLSHPPASRTHCSASLSAARPSRCGSFLLGQPCPHRCLNLKLLIWAPIISNRTRDASGSPNLLAPQFPLLGNPHAAILRL